MYPITDELYHFEEKYPKVIQIFFFFLKNVRSGSDLAKKFQIWVYNIAKKTKNKIIFY
jgi:hypothetical protein